MTTNVRLKIINKNAPPNRSKVIEVAYGALNVPFTRLFATSDGFKAVCRNNDDADVILGPAGAQAFQGIGLQVVMPPELRAKRSIFIRQLDYEFGKHTAEEIKEEIETKNAWAKVDEVIKIKNYTHCVKIRFAETAITDKALSDGFLAFNMSIVPSQMEREKFVNLLSCFTCYALEDHPTKDCPNKGSKWCSECAEQGHTYRECQNVNKACINCKKFENPDYKTHRTLSMACPYKKRLIKEKTEEQKKTEEEKKNSTYASIAKKAVHEVMQPKPATNIVLSGLKDTKILISILYAHVMNISNPGSFESEMNQMLEMNGLPKMKFPPNPDSGRLLHATGIENLPESVKNTGASALETVQPTEEEQESSLESDVEIEQIDDQPEASKPKIVIVEPKLPNEKQEDKGAIRKISAGKNVDPRIKQGSEETFPSTADELGLTIYHTNRKFPQDFGTFTGIIQGIQNRELKWTYTNEVYTPNLVEAYLFRQKIRVHKENFKLVDTEKFKKINNGLLLEQRSPPEVSTKSKKGRYHEH